MTTSKGQPRPALPALETSELLESKTSPVGLAEYEKLAPAQPPPDYPGPSNQVSPNSQRVLPAPPSPQPLPGAPYSSNAHPAPALQESFNKNADRCDHRESRRYGALGIIVGIALFPVGLICTRLDSKLVCRRCGATVYKTPGGWYAQQEYGEATYRDARGR